MIKTTFALSCRILRDAGFDTRQTNDGATGVQLAIAAAPDLVITDMLMPAPDGIETILALRAGIPSLPILAISGGGVLGTNELAEMARTFGASAFLAKPFRPQELLNTVKALLAA